MADIVDTKASDDILIIPVSVQSIILPDKNLSVSSFLQFSLPSASITTAPPLCKYFSTDSPPEDSLYLDYLRTQPLPQLAVLHKLLEGVQHAISGGSRSIIYAHADIEQPFPFWILTFWHQAYTLLDVQSNWRQAEAFLTKHQPNESQHNPTLKGQTAADVREAFVRQFERYVKGQYPFDTMMDAGQDVLSYWTHLTKIPEGSILACIAEKIYSIKPSSVPEERTMSVFTRMNTPARNRQHVRTLVDMTQIRQWHMYDPKKMVERQHPDISFCDLDSIISSPKQSAARRSHETTGSYLSVGTDEQEEILEDEEGTWLDETLAVIVTKALSDEHEESPRRHGQRVGRILVVVVNNPTHPYCPLCIVIEYWCEFIREHDANSRRDIVALECPQGIVRAIDIGLHTKTFSVLNWLKVPINIARCAHHYSRSGIDSSNSPFEETIAWRRGRGHGLERSIIRLLGPPLTVPAFSGHSNLAIDLQCQHAFGPLNISNNTVLERYDAVLLRFADGESGGNESSAFCCPEYHTHP